MDLPKFMPQVYTAPQRLGKLVNADAILKTRPQSPLFTRLWWGPLDFSTGWSAYLL
jgi:hypothetical protein